MTDRKLVSHTAGDGQSPRLWRPSRPLGVARAITKAGYATRARAEALVRAGRVQIDDRVVIDASAAVGPDSVIRLDGRPLLEIPRRYLALHKPARVVMDPSERSRGRKIEEFVPVDVPGLRPAGRLDINTTGLMLVSNDSLWNATVAGGNCLEKDFEIEVRGRVGEMELSVITAGMHLPGLGTIRPRHAAVIRGGPERTLLRLTIVEGKIRQIRRIFSSLRHDILSMRRVRIGPVQLGNLPPGRWRVLTPEEIEAIRQGARAD